MKATELVHQYHAKTITARELVDGVWETSEYDTECSQGGSWRYKEPHPLHVLGWFGWDKSSPDALVKLRAAAAAFTVSRIEEIRQAKQDVFIVELQWSYSKTRTEIHIKNAWEISALTNAIECVRWSRILARERSVLAKLSRGIRPEVLA